MSCESLVIKIKNSPKLYSKSKFLAETSPELNGRGLYAWFFKNIPPCVPIDGCVVHDEGQVLLYVGTSTSAKSKKGKNDRILRKRIIEHFSGKVGNSTLRRSLSVLLMKQVNWKISPDGKKFILPDCDEEWLSDWMEENAFVAWMKHDTPWDVESDVIKRLPVRLNNHHSDHPFKKELSEKRSAAKRQARDQAKNNLGL